MPLHRLIVFAVLLFALFPACVAAQSNPLPLGTLSIVGPVACPAGFLGHSICQSAVVDCPNVAELSVTVGYKPGTNGKTVMLVNGSGWTAVAPQKFAAQYAADGYSMIEAVWPTPWEVAGSGYTPNVMIAACRVATLIDWAFWNYAPTGLRVQSLSGGAGAVGFALSWYGLSGEILAATFTSGPVFSDIVAGCIMPAAPSITVVATDGTTWSDFPHYTQAVNQMTTWTGFQCEMKPPTSPAALASWGSQEILAPDVLTSLVTPHIVGWLCQTAQTQNNSAAQGYLWLSKVPGAIINAVVGCSGTEGVQDGTWNGGSAFAAIVADMEAN